VASGSTVLALVIGFAGIVGSALVVVSFTGRAGTEARSAVGEAIRRIDDEATAFGQAASFGRRRTDRVGARGTRFLRLPALFTAGERIGVDAITLGETAGPR
jgi:hypothetical protein